MIYHSNKVIKFRAWDKENKKLIYQDGDWSFDDEYNDLCFQFPHVEYGNNKRYELTQFIGMTDKNGKDIYEGDIVKDHTVGTKWVIVWCPECSGYADGHSHGYHIYHPYKSLEKSLEVVDNIFENGTFEPKSYCGNCEELLHDPDAELCPTCEANENMGNEYGA